jgi:hypothetical protein
MFDVDRLPRRPAIREAQMPRRRMQQVSGVSERKEEEAPYQLVTL